MGVAFLERTITNKEVTYLRELARKQLAYANLPVMRERAEAWRRHNACAGARPMISFDYGSFRGDFLPELKCKSRDARGIETTLLLNTLNHEVINDDKVVPDFFPLSWRVGFERPGVKMNRTRGKDASGRDTKGYKTEKVFDSAGEALERLKPSVFSVDREGTHRYKETVEEVLGDILPVRIDNTSLRWTFGPSAVIVHMLGMEEMMIGMAEDPDEMRALYDFITEDMLRYAAWLETEGLLTLNNGNHYTGAGSWGFTDELPRTDHDPSGPVRARDLWVNMNSQETVGISARMYEEIVFPSYMRIAEAFGLGYYGCCEQVHDIWETCISRLPNLRKVSISPWCDEDRMGEYLRGGKVIYSRKPSPNFLGVAEYDEDGLRTHIIETLKAARGCTLELIFRDIYRLQRDPSRLGKATKLTRRLIDEYWKD